jgi:hypothetical protein
MSEYASASRYSYSIFGIRVTSDFPLEFPADAEACARSPLAHVDFVEGVEDDFLPFASLTESEIEPGYWPLPGGPAYLRWPDWYECSVSADGSRVACRWLHGCDRAVLQNFLFGQALAVALVHQGIEPLHAAVVRVNDCAIGFLGDCTFGKSTLLATFLQAGHRAVTDDLLILDRRSGNTVALPGSGRIKLLPDSADRFLDDRDSGMPLNPLTTKCSFPIDASRQQRTGLPLRRLFVLPEPGERDRITSIEIWPASPAEMVHELLKNTFAGQILESARLVRQFDHAVQLATEVDGFRLRYPSGLNHLPALRQAIVEHVHHVQASS